MPPLICASPAILDQSRERGVGDLRRIACAIGNMAELLTEDAAHVVLTTVLRDVVTSFADQPWEHHGLMQDIFRLLSQWFLQRHRGLIELNLSKIVGYQPHPLPLGCIGDHLALFWADEMGRLLIVHDEQGAPGGFSVGIACDRAFAGEPVGAYADSVSERVFPLVGPEETRSSLVDAYDWEIETDILRKRVTLQMAKANCCALGAAGISRPRRDSHWKFIFLGKRNWTLSENDDPVPIAYLRELSTITGYPLGVVRQALLTGSLPRRRLRFERYVC